MTKGRSHLHGDDGGGDPVDGRAERGPPACVGNIVTAVLPEVLQPVAGQAEDEEPRRSGDACRGEHHEYARDAALDGDDGRAAVGYSEADVHPMRSGPGTGRRRSLRRATRSRGATQLGLRPRQLPRSRVRGRWRTAFGVST